MIFSQKRSDEKICALGVKNNLDMDKLLAGYLIMGEQFLLMLHVFEGQELHIPSSRRLSSPSLKNIHFIEDDKRIYKDYEKDDVIDLNDNEFTVVDSEKKILNHWYIPVIKVEE